MITSLDRYQVVSVYPQTEEDAALIHWFVEKLQLDQWTNSKILGAPVDIMMSSRQAASFTNIIKAKGIPTKIKIKDVQRLIDEEASLLQNVTKRQSRDFDHTAYHELDTIYGMLDQVATKFPDMVTSYIAGKTYEGREIRVSAISTGGEGTKEVIWIDCGIHSREWVAISTCQYILDQLTSGVGKDETTDSLLDQYDFHIMTVANPDGYVYTWLPSGNRLWRKNRVLNKGFLKCHGVDPNRNFDSDFGGPGTSDNPCVEIYHGPSAFSEAESSAIRDSILNLGGRVSMFITIHAYSQLWMTPYGYTQDLPASYEDQYRVAEIGVKALTAVHGTEFSYGNIASIICAVFDKNEELFLCVQQQVAYIACLEVSLIGMRPHKQS
ncbi:carboxypeptidase B-like isoform X3 [Macrobrachium nipponense]|uniref:carboxypeptidase B-like isoform X3 n=1 Tax=Macrobrachium nipponense TaxID=159736 RepID=UPI0030C8302A